MATFNVSGLKWTFYHNTNPEWLGMLPLIVLDTDPRPVREQVAQRYSNGGGWRPYKGFKTGIGMDNRMTLSYPGDPPQQLIAECLHSNGETIRLFESAWVMVTQRDGSYEVSRMD